MSRPNEEGPPILIIFSHGDVRQFWREGNFNAGHKKPTPTTKKLRFQMGPLLLLPLAPLGYILFI
jgi:hypothetical protein